MIKQINSKIKELNNMKKYPDELFYIGNLNLLQKPKISIVGSRSPDQYSRGLIHKISSKLSQVGICIVSGGAMGIDTIAHQSSGLHNTIMVAGTGLDKRYPAINKNMIEEIEKEGLVISQFKVGVPSNRWNFPLRNEIVVALGDVLIVAYADIKSGTMRSVEYALKMGKPIFVLPHRIGESDGTNKLLKDGTAKAIYDIDEFIADFSSVLTDGIKDEFLEYCKTNPTYDEAVSKYSAKVFEYELLGKIKIENGFIIL
ncbi:MAG: DNA-processing protein DprA [Thermoplasmata archaeon]|nr:MAG: DNA-processing protein DprA [Thermoplasmata archaeon]